MELYLKLIDVIAPVFFVIGVGYYLGIKNPEISTDFITTFAGNVGTPAMIFYFLALGAWEPTPESPESLLRAPLGAHHPQKIAPRCPKCLPRCQKVPQSLPKAPF